MRNIFSIDVVPGSFSCLYELQKNFPIRVDPLRSIIYRIYEPEEAEILDVDVHPRTNDLVILGHECTEDLAAKRADFMCIYLPSGNQAYCYVYDIKKKIAKADKFLKLVVQLKSTLEYANSLVYQAVPNSKIVNQVGVVTELFDLADVQNQYASLASRFVDVSGSQDLTALNLERMNLASNINERLRMLELLLSRKIKLGIEVYSLDVRFFDANKHHTLKFKSTGMLT